jgi:hypothetical protein
VAYRAIESRSGNNLCNSHRLTGRARNDPSLALRAGIVPPRLRFGLVLFPRLRFGLVLFPRSRFGLVVFSYQRSSD